MLCLRCSRGVNAVIMAPTTARVTPSLQASAKRTFTSFTPLRPTIFPTTSAFRPSPTISPSSLATATGEAPLDLLPKISTHPALAGASQVRCGPRNTFDPSHFVRKRRHGFLSRNRTRKGRATLTRRRLKKRTNLSH